MGDCRRCNNQLKPNYPHSTAKGLCFPCYFWEEKLEWVNDPRSVRCEGRHYFVGEENNQPAYMKGCGGHKYVIEFNDGRVVTTTNLWSQGIIPNHFRDELPDNAIIRSN